MSLKHGLLGLLNYGPMTGYDLDKAFKASLNFFWQAQTSQVYRELNAMEKTGWLTSEIEFQTGKPNKKIYSITTTGKQELVRWLADENGDADTQMRNEFLMKLFFSGERSVEENIAMLQSFCRECREGLALIGRTDGSIANYGEGLHGADKQKAVYWGLTARFGIAYMQMCLDFAEEAIRILEEIK